MPKVFGHYKLLSNQPGWLVSLCLGVFALSLSFVLSIFSGRYADSRAGTKVDDILLDNLPLFDVSLIHIYAATLFWFFILWASFLRPYALCFALKTTAMFLCIRSVFVVMTHLGAPENLLRLPEDMTSLYIYQGDLFFSGHAGGPFLFGLIFWQEKILRMICLVATLFFSVIVFLGGIHYSIDVFASYFIAHSIFTFSKKLFRKDYSLILIKLD